MDKATEYLPCNFCGKDIYRVLSVKDRYGFPTRTVICKNCGLIYINPRMSFEEYQKFYENDYRNLLTRVHQSPDDDPKDMDQLFDSGKVKGRVLGEYAKQFVRPGLTIEVGSSCGGILAGFKEKITGDYELIGIEPSPEEADYAEKKGIRTHVGLIEQFEEKLPKAQNIIIARSLNHLLSPREFFSWSHKQLEPGGVLILLTLNFPVHCRMLGRLETQIDHPYMFAEGVLSDFVKSAGFDVKFTGTKGRYIYIVANKSNKTPFQNIHSNVLHYRELVKQLNPFRLNLMHKKAGLMKRIRKGFK